MQKHFEPNSWLTTTHQAEADLPASLHTPAVSGLGMQRDMGREIADGKDLSQVQTIREFQALPTSEQRDQAMMEHLTTVRFIARKIHERLPQHVEMEDLVSAGVLGLIDAFQKFDPSKKVQFRSYAQFRIRGAILDSLRLVDWSPRELRRKGRAVENTIRTLTQRLHRTPSETEIAADLNLDLNAYQQLLGNLRGLNIGTLHLEHSEDSGEEELAYIPTTAEDDPLFRCLRTEMQDEVTHAIEALPERERTVVTLYYYEEMTMREIGLALGVVESRISQIHSSAILRLRAELRGVPERRRGACKQNRRSSLSAMPDRRITRVQ